LDDNSYLKKLIQSCRNFLNFVTEEIEDSQKTLPRAIYISLPIVSFVYVMANVAYFTRMDVPEIISSLETAVVRLTFINTNLYQMSDYLITIYFIYFFCRFLETSSWG